MHLGWGEEEKHHPQQVSITLEFTFCAPPLGVTTDQLSDTLCYASIVEHVQHLVHKKRFNLIEHLAGCIYTVICTLVAEGNIPLSLLKVTVCKMAPPIPGIHGGVSFTYSAAPQHLL